MKASGWTGRGADDALVGGTPHSSVFVSAGEASGDRYAARVVRVLRAQAPELSFWGGGGPLLTAAGLECLQRSETLAVTGLSELRSVASAALGYLARSAYLLARRRPRLALLVDYPGINLRLAAICKRLSIPVLYYVAPQRWAWLTSRASALSRCIDVLAVTLPFEEAFFSARGVKASFVGHPLLDEDAMAMGSEGPLVGLFPGSRRKELERHLPVLAPLPDKSPLRAMAVGVADPARAAQCALHAPGLARLSGEELLSRCNVALCASGTITLELALRQKPMAVFYRMEALSYIAARRLVRLRYVALPNLVLGRGVVPELLQDAMTVDALTRQLDDLDHPRTQSLQREAFEELRQRLGRAGAAERVAAIAFELMERPTRR